MNIAIDGNEANVSQRVGSNVYAYEVLKQLNQQDKNTPYQVLLKSPPRSDLPATRKTWCYRTFGPGKLWTQWRLPLDLFLHQPRPQLIFTPGHYAPRVSPVPSVITILDLAFLYFPDAFQPRVLRQLKNWTRYSVAQASHVLTISEHSKKDVIKEYGIKPDQITVTHLGSHISKPSDWQAEDIEVFKEKFRIPTPYFIFIGTRQPRKNLDRLITAYKKLHSRERNISLVLVGKVWDQFKHVKLENHSNIIATGFVSDTELKKLLLGSEALVFPSLYEGFGLPVLEAMQLGVLVAASNTSSLPEITGKTPLQFDPYEVSQIQIVMETILRMEPTKKKKLIRQGKIRARQFSWERCGRVTQEVLHQVASAKI